MAQKLINSGRLKGGQQFFDFPSKSVIGLVVWSSWCRRFAEAWRVRSQTRYQAVPTLSAKPWPRTAVAGGRSREGGERDFFRRGVLLIRLSIFLSRRKFLIYSPSRFRGPNRDSCLPAYVLSVGLTNQ